MADGEVVLRPAEVNGREALEMKHPAVEGLLGVEEPAAAALLVDGGTWILVVTLMVYDTEVRPLDQTWAGVRASLEVEPPSAVAARALLYGGIGLVGLIMLVFLLRFLSRRRPAPTVAPIRVVEVDAGPVGGRDFTIPEPTPYTPAETATAPLAASSPVVPTPAAPAPDPQPLRVASMEGGASDADGSADTPSEQTASEPAPPPLPRAGTTPTPGAEAGAPPPLPSKPAATPKPPARKGLRPTLPANGRWSD